MTWTTTHYTSSVTPQRAYGAAIYLRSTDTTYVQLVCSEARLAPLKRVTLSRLELLAALVGARLLRYFCQAAGRDITSATMWTYSAVTLGWIRRDPNRWKNFICNRVTEITYTSPSQWFHCPGPDNQADYLSRGCRAQDLIESEKWWHGLPWLREPPSPPKCDPQTPSTDHLPLREARKHQDTLLFDKQEPLIPFSRFSSYTKLLRTMGWILRFTKNIRSKQKQHGELTTSELTTSQFHLICNAQRESFAAEYYALDSSSHFRQTRGSPHFIRFLRTV